MPATTRCASGSTPAGGAEYVTLRRGVMARHSDPDMTRRTPHAPMLLLAALALCAPAASAATQGDCASPATQAAMASCAYDEFLAANAQQAQLQRH
jgi:hypothetical protein